MIISPKYAGLTLVIVSAMFGGISTFLHAYGTQVDGVVQYGLTYTFSLAVASGLIQQSRLRKNNSGSSAVGKNQNRIHQTRIPQRTSYVFISILSYIAGHIILFRVASVITASELAIAGRSYLIFAFILAVLLGSQKLKIGQALYILLFTCFVLIIADFDSGIALTGTFLAIMAYFAFALYNFLLSRLDLFNADGMNALSSAATFVVLALFNQHDIMALNISSWAVLSAFAYSFSHTFFYRSLKSMDFVSASYIRATSPFFVLLLSWIIVPETITFQAFVALIGVVIIQLLWQKDIQPDR